jgi:ribose transport system ATP-binding protein
LNVRFVHQGLGLAEEMNAVDNIALAGGYQVGRAGRISWRRQAQVARELLGRLGLDDVDIWKPVSDCSAVERTGIAIARALAGSAPGRGLLVLDEPSVALANADIERLFDIVRTLAASGLSILYVSHFLDEVFAICDRVTILRDGRVVDSAAVSSFDKRSLVEAMVGQTIDFTKRSATMSVASGELALRLTGIKGREIRRLDLDVAPGEIVGVAGSTGSGRTELPLVLVGARALAGGEIELRSGPVRGRVSPERMRERGLVLVPADRHRQGSHPDMTVAENATLADLSPFKVGARWISRAKEHAFISRVSDDLDLRPRNPDAVFGSLSGGNQQKVVLAKWLAVEPRVLVLDEPTSGVDVAARDMIYDAVRGQAQAGLGVLVCSADVDELVQLCHRIVVLRHGEVVAEYRGDSCTSAEIIHALEGGSMSTEGGR